jgi:hypothetical protein
MHRQVVRVHGQLRQDLLAEAHADPQRFRMRSGQRPVVIALAAAEALAAAGEGHAGAEEELDFLDGDHRGIRQRLGEAEGAGMEPGQDGVDEVESHGFALDPRQGPTAVPQVGNQRQEQRFARDRHEGGDGFRRLAGEPVAKVPADRAGLPELRLQVRTVGAEHPAQGWLGWSCHLHWAGWSRNLAVVNVRWQAVACILCIAATAGAAEEKAKFEWKPPVVGAGVFTDQLGMLDREREEYANNLAGYASNRIAAAKASAASLNEGRRLVALALHLAPRNRKALVLSFQLTRGVVPEADPQNFRPEVLAGLLFTRSQVLKEQGGAENQLLSRVFTELAAEMDPKNDDAVYASELQRLDQGAVDWSALTDVKKPAEEPEREGRP